MAGYVIDPTWSGDPALLVDEPSDRALRAREVLHRGYVWDLVRDTVDLGDGQTVVREFVAHTGAVGVVALDDQDRVLLIRQYRHPLGMMLWEPVAGLLDVDAESPRDAAARELVEEAGLTAGRWDVLVDVELSPGGSSEAIRIYLARDLEPVPGGRPAGEGEERDLPVAWVPLTTALEGVLAGRLTSPSTVAGVLAAHASRAGGWSSLRPGTAAWPQRDHLVSQDRTRLRPEDDS